MKSIELKQQALLRNAICETFESETFAPTGSIDKAKLLVQIALLWLDRGGGVQDTLHAEKQFCRITDEVKTSFGVTFKT